VHRSLYAWLTWFLKPAELRNRGIIRATPNNAGTVATPFKAKGNCPMLLLTRRVGESILIKLPTGEQIQVAVLGIKGNQVRIGTDAPEKVQILREELYEPDIT